MEQDKHSQSLNNSSPIYNTIYRNYDHELSSEFHTDSAYSSGYNLSSCDTPNTSHNIELEIRTPRVNINETSKDSIKLTPVTQNICRIFNFHITTPKSVDFNKKQSVGVKRSSQFNLQSTPKKKKLINENDQENQSYGSKTPSKPIQKKQPLSESKQNVFDRLHSAPDLKDNTSFIKFNSHYSSANRMPTITETLSDKTNSIKKLLKCSNDEFEAILKTDVTPSKEGSFQDYRTSYSIKSAYSFEKKKASSDGKTSFCRTLSFATSPKTESNNFQKAQSVELNTSDICIDASETRKNLNATQRSCEMGISPSELRKNLNVTQGSCDMDISPSVPIKFNKHYSSGKPDKLTDYNIMPIECENIPVTPMKRKISIDDTVKETSYPKTPKKIKYRFSPKQLDSKQFKKISKQTAKNLIVPNFRTPTKFNSKKHQHLRLHQQKTAELVSRQSNSSILEKLCRYPILIDNIFSHLSSYDLLNLKRVSKSCSNIINNHRRTKVRIENFVSDYRICKENFNEKDFDKVKDKLLDSQIIHVDKTFDKKIPFSNNNSEIRQALVEKCEEEPTKIKGFSSPNVSPSKRKFYENQKVVHTLSAKQHCVKCPRCEKPSRAIIQDEINSELNTEISASLSYTDHNRINNKAEINHSSSICIMDSTQFQPLLKKKLIKTMSVDSGLYMKRPERRNSSLTSTFQPYGECTALSCNFKFCLKCYCEYHPGKLCVLELDTGSPKKDDINEKIGSKSNRSFQRRKSLKRLCF